MIISYNKNVSAFTGNGLIILKENEYTYYYSVKGKNLATAENFTDNSFHKKLIKFANFDLSNLNQLSNKLVSDLIPRLKKIVSAKNKVTDEMWAPVFYSQYEEISKELYKIHDFFKTPDNYFYIAEVIERSYSYQFLELCYKNNYNFDIFLDYVETCEKKCNCCEHSTICEKFNIYKTTSRYLIGSILNMISSPFEQEIFNFDSDLFDNFVGSCFENQLNEISASFNRTPFKKDLVENCKYYIEYPFFELLESQQSIQSFFLWNTTNALETISNFTPNDKIVLYGLLIRNILFNQNNYNKASRANLLNYIFDFTDFRNSDLTKKIFIDSENIATSVKEQVNKNLRIIRDLIKDNDCTNSELFFINNFIEFLKIELEQLSEQMIKNKLFIKCCKLCNHYFITNKNSIKYCSNKNPLYGKACNKVDKNRKREADPFLNIYDKAIKREQAKFLYYTQKRDTDDNLKSKYFRLNNKKIEKWKKEAEEKLTDAKNGKITLDEFCEWIENTNYTDDAFEN